MSAIRRSVVASFADKYVSQVIAVATLAVMSRILTPAEIGLYMLANTVIMLADNLRLFGIGTYIVQARELDRVAIRTAFTVTLVVSIGVALAINLTASRISGFFHAPELARLVSLSTLAFCVLPFGAPLVALLQRELAFTALAWMNVAAAFINAAVTIALGATGFGAASYVWGFVAASAAATIMAILFRPDLWIFRPSLAGARRIISFGMLSSSVTLINVAYDLLPRLALGRLLGVDAVGIYARAVTVCQLPDRAIVSALQPVVLPAMAAHSRSGGHLKASYLRGLTLMSAIQWPALMMLALLADPVVRLLLGPQWGEAVPLARMIALATMALAPAFLTFPVLVATGRIRDSLLSSLIALPPSALIVIGAATIGLWQVAASMLVIAPLQMFVALLFVRRAIDLNWSELLIPARASAAMTIGTAIPAMLVLALSPNGLALGFGETAVAILGGGLGWLAALHLLDHPLKSELWSVLRMVRATGSGRGLSGRAAGE